MELERGMTKVRLTEGTITEEKMLVEEARVEAKGGGARVEMKERKTRGKRMWLLT